MKEGIVVLRQNKGLFALLLLGTLYTFVYMPINALFPLISMEAKFQVQISQPVKTL